MIWTPRPDSTDAQIIKEVYEDNIYQMPGDMTGMFVVDVGAHIGTFSVLCAERGATMVRAYEPNIWNYTELAHNAFSWPITPIRIGLGAEPGWAQMWLNTNTGGHSTVLQVSDSTCQVAVIPLELMLGDPTHVIDVLKLDCEGAEKYALPALAAGLHAQVKRIVMEFHTDEQVELRKLIEPYYDGYNIFQGMWSFTHK